MEISLGKVLSKEKYEELVKGTLLEGVSLDDLVDIALNSEEMNPGKNKIWEYAGAYYRYNEFTYPVIVIDREQTIGGYNNSELVITLINKKYIATNDRTFTRLILSKLEEKQNNKDL